ncbi:MAG: SDR family NAD(P)-dependent oxidoreductase [Christensenellales bacterium]|jgi:short-subunit dehydrogenase
MQVLITGAAGGLGRAFAVECAARGYDLMLTDLDACGLQAIGQGIQKRYGVRVMTQACDLTQPQAADKLLEYCKNQNMDVQMLLNVAGVDFEGGFLQRSGQSIAQIVRLNIEATLCVTHRALEARRGDAPFYIVFVSSLASLYPMPLKATYAASKRFLLDFGCALGQELKSDNVRVLTLCPGGLATTEQVMEAIAAQGLWGSGTTNHLESVTRRSIDGVLRGRRTYIPGALNRVLAALGRLIPRKMLAAILYRRWRQAQSHWLENPAQGAQASPEKVKEPA